ncbi:hypothetical protein Tco_0449496 [Tanacetum coccineum]
MFKPKTLADAYCLTNLQEATLNDVKKSEGEFLDADEIVVDSGLVDSQAPLISLNALIGTNNFKNMRVIRTIDVMLLTLGGCDMVLGIQWLSTLGDIRFKFHELRMDFMYNNKKVLLRGTHKSNLDWLGTKTSEKIVRQSELHSMAICVFPNSASTCIQMEETTTFIHPVLQQVVEEYEDVFAIPTELPPKRGHDHKIPLLEGAQLVNIRPYRHPLT